MSIVLHFLLKSLLVVALAVGWLSLDREASAQLDPANKVYRVDEDSTAVTPDGQSWATAYTYLQDAIDAADSYLLINSSHYVDIWVKGAEEDSVTGPLVYYPDEGSGQTNNATGSSFVLNNHVQLLGGFAGNESNRNARSPLANICILSGDLAKDDNPADPFNSSLTDDNANHVVKTGAFVDDAVIDGFRIQSGNATPSGVNIGGGFYNSEASPTVLRCTFTRNQATGGGGVAIDGDGSPRFINCLFHDNTAGFGGGLYQKDSASSTLLNCLFHDNSAGTGGAIYSAGIEMMIVNATIADNMSTNQPGGVYSGSDNDLTIVSSILWNNDGTATADQLVSDGTESVTYTDLQGSWSGPTNINSDPDFVSGYDLDPLSPCIDAGDTPTIEDPTYADVFDLNRNSDDAEPTPDLELDCRVADGVVDMGAYEYQVDSRPACPADLFPVGAGDASVGAGDLGELLANWGSCPSCPADLYPVGSPDGTVGSGDLGQLLANWGQCARVSCTSQFASGASDGGDVQWPEVEMTDELSDWIMSSPLDDIWDWLWSLLEE